MKKSLFLISLSLLLGLPVAQAKTCLIAQNPANIMIAALDAEGGKVTHSEQALVAQAVLEDESFNKKENYAIPASFSLYAQSENLEFNTIASRYDAKKKNVYGVDCDGGSVKLTQVKSGYVVSSDYLAGDVAVKGEEGCSSGTVKLKKVIFKTVPCAK